MLSHATGASTNAILIGNTQQASAALFYVLPYLCKSKYALEACLSALENVQRHIEEFPSVADNTGADTRCVQHMFTKVLNDLCQSVELSDTQIALDLLNTGSEKTSDSYQFLVQFWFELFFVTTATKPSNITSKCRRQVFFDGSSKHSSLSNGSWWPFWSSTFLQNF